MTGEKPEYMAEIYFIHVEAWHEMTRFLTSEQVCSLADQLGAYCRNFAMMRNGLGELDMGVVLNQVYMASDEIQTVTVNGVTVPLWRLWESLHLTGLVKRYADPRATL